MKRGPRKSHLVDLEQEVQRIEVAKAEVANDAEPETVRGSIKYPLPAYVRVMLIDVS